MINTGKRISSIGLIIILTIILVAIATLSWIFLSDRDSQQNKIYSGAKLVEQGETWRSGNEGSPANTYY